jgi:hypothetical protein
MGKRARLLVGLLCALALLLTACGTAKGEPTAQGAAAEFMSAIAADDVTRAQAVSARPISESDVTGLRDSLFGQDASRHPSAFEFVAGIQVEGERVPTTYLVLSAYTAEGTGHWPPRDDPATASSWGSVTERYQIGLRKQGSGWLVVSWTGPSGVVQ